MLHKLIQEWDKSTKECIDNLSNLKLQEQHISLKQSGFQKVGSYFTNEEYSKLISKMGSVTFKPISVSNLKTKNKIDLYVSVIPSLISYGYVNP